MGLSSRLQAIYDHVPSGSTFADIGTDHGYLAAALLEHGKCPFGIAADINPMPLKKAKTLLEHRGCQSISECRLGNGLQVLSTDEVKVIIMAGMGGYLMADLLAASPDVAESAKQLILQPMSNASVLRHYIQQNGFLIVDEVVVREGDLFYQIISVEKGEMDPLTDVEALCGYTPCLTCDETFKDFVKYLIQKTENTLIRLEDKDTENALQRKKECQTLIEALKNLYDTILIEGG